MKHIRILLRLLPVLLALLAVLVFRRFHEVRTVKVFAQSQSMTAAVELQTTNGGMAVYGSALMQSTSSSATLQAISNWNSYVNARTAWSVPSTLISRLANADWNARQLGSPTITAQQLANAANHLINNQLSTMTAAQQQALFQQMFSTQTPKGRIGLNPNYSHVSASQSSSGLWTVTVDPTAFSSMKSNLRTLAPGMLSTSANFYPGEAMIVTYSVATWDMGYGNDYISKVKKRLSDLTGLDMTNQLLYGDQGYLIRRPLQTFFTNSSLSQFFTELSF